MPESATIGSNLPTAGSGSPDTVSRIKSVDLIRGTVLILMAIDHVRVYSGLPSGGPTPGIFFTRWITHFCAPAFIFLAGTSAFFYGRKHTDLPRFLVTRGLWLILLELTVLRFAWTFNFDYAHYEMAGVIWVIGLSMIVLAAISKLPTVAVAAFGLGIIFCHNMLDGYAASIAANAGNGFTDSLWKVFYIAFFAGPISFGENGPNLTVLYSLIPWMGVMAAGYAFGNLLTLEPTRRKTLCLAIGVGAIALFLVLRGINMYGDPRHWAAGVQKPGGPPPIPAFLSFLNTTKYPASLDFLLMTLGPVIGLIPLLERARGFAANVITIFGRVPFFFYVLHIPLIHLLAIGVSILTTGAINPWLFANHPMGNPSPPPGYTWDLGLLYLVWTIVIILLYFACRWYAALKTRRNDWWLKFI